MNSHRGGFTFQVRHANDFNGFTLEIDANKRIRRFLPANTDLARLPQATLNQLAPMLNDQPRKCLGYKTPAKVFAMHLREEG